MFEVEQGMGKFMLGDVLDNKARAPAEFREPVELLGALRVKFCGRDDGGAAGAIAAGDKARAEDARGEGAERPARVDAVGFNVLGRNDVGGELPECAGFAGDVADAGGEGGGGEGRQK